MSLLDYLRFRFARPRYRLTEHEQYLASPEFLRSREWLTLQYKTLKRYGGRCMVCGRSARGGAVINIDHVKPRRLYPQLALNPVVRNNRIAASQAG